VKCWPRGAGRARRWCRGQGRQICTRARPFASLAEVPGPRSRERAKAEGCLTR
jgi:hypothetical protein